MPLPEDKVVTAPLKNMDIKSAFMAAANRKRKASSPTVPKNQPKNLKLADDKSDDAVVITDEDVVIISDCKENTDVNTADVQNIVQLDRKLSNEDVNTEIDKTCTETNTETKSISADNVDEDSDSSDDLNSSNLNNSAMVSELSEEGDNRNKSQSDLNTSVECNNVTSEKKTKSVDDNQKDTRPRKKKKMTPVEAKARAVEREQKNEEKLLKKQELEAQRLQRKIEKEKLKIQKEREKQEKEEERKEKERLRLEKKEQEEKERLQKLKEKEESKKQRQLMLEMKQEEKKKKEEMRLKREEEMKKAEEEKQKAKLEKEQKEKEKQEKAKAAFFKFFKKESVSTPPTVQTNEQEGAFKPFQVSDDMTLAPVVPVAAQERFDKEQLDHALKFQDGLKLYLDILKSGKYKDVRLRRRLRKQRMCDAEVIILDKKAALQLFLTAKLLQFSENVRPPYWGTWRKQSKNVGPRKPFGQDNIFDYEVDSDDEWDEGGPGESLSGTENELESEDDYEVDNEFFVPHGYLSADEEKEDEEAVNDPEKQQAMLKLKQQEFESERKKKTTELKPIILGCYFEHVSESQDVGLRTFLVTYSAEIVSETPIPTCFTVKKQQAESAPNSSSNSPSTSNILRKGKVPEEAVPHLIRLLHGNVNSRDALIKEFQSFWLQHSQSTAPNSENVSPKKTESASEPETGTPKQEMTPDVSTPDLKGISKRQLVLVIKKISTYGKCPNPILKKHCWWVHDEIREKYGLLDVPIPNEWGSGSAPAKEDVESSSAAKNCASIKGFLIP